MGLSRPNSQIPVSSISFRVTENLRRSVVYYPSGDGKRCDPTQYIAEEAARSDDCPQEKPVGLAQMARISRFT